MGRSERAAPIHQCVSDARDAHLWTYASIDATRTIVATGETRPIDAEARGQREVPLGRKFAASASLNSAGAFASQPGGRKMAAIADVVLAGRSVRVIDLPSIGSQSLARLPWLHRIFLENLLRRTPADDPARTAIPSWLALAQSDAEIPF